MTWKSTVFVSGAGLLATWLASVPSLSTTPTLTTPRAEPRNISAPVSSEIADEADRLERRSRSDDTYRTSSRNLFRFGPARPSSHTSRTPAVPAVADVMPAAPVVSIRLSGVAMDRVGEREVRTAILSTPTGVVLAREGEEIAPGWTVSTIDAESVGLTRPDGSMLTLPLSGK